MCSCCCCCCSAALVVVVSATVCFIFYVFFYILWFFFAFFINEFSFTFIKQLRSQANKLFYADTHIHISTRTHSHTHTHAHARTHTKGYVVGSFVVYRLLVLFFIDFFLRCAFAAVWFANAAKIAIKCSFYQFHSLSLALFLLLLSLAWRRNCKLPHATLTSTALPWALSSVN